MLINALHFKNINLLEKYKLPNLVNNKNKRKMQVETKF